MRHMIAKAKQNKKQHQALVKLSNILERMSKRKTNKRKEMPTIFRLTQKKLWKRASSLLLINSDTRQSDVLCMALAPSFPSPEARESETIPRNLVE